MALTLGKKAHSKQSKLLCSVGPNSKPMLIAKREAPFSGPSNML